jgi:hypothetical protein
MRGPGVMSHSLLLRDQPYSRVTCWTMYQNSLVFSQSDTDPYTVEFCWPQNMKLNFIPFSSLSFSFFFPPPKLYIYVSFLFRRAIYPSHRRDTIVFTNPVYLYIQSTLGSRTVWFSNNLKLEKKFEKNSVWNSNKNSKVEPWARHYTASCGSCSFNSKVEKTESRTASCNGLCSTFEGPLYIYSYYHIAYPISHKHTTWSYLRLPPVH